MYTRRAYPWIASILLHFFVMFIPFGLWWSFGTPGGRVTLVFDFEPAAGPPTRQGAAVIPARPAAPEAVPAHISPNQEQQNDVAQPETTDTSQTVPEPDQAVPSADDGTVYSNAGGGGEVSSRIGWQGQTREVLTRTPLAFPHVLSYSGQEAECEARITVTPLGTVSKVEITKASGYTEIDASVVAALWGYLFSRDYGVEKKSAVAVMRFRFRLETLD
jgi:TonB family protein